MGFHQNKKFSESEIKILDQSIKSTELATDLKRLQAVYFRAVFQMKSDQIAELLKYSEKHVKVIWSLYFKGGVEALITQRKGGRNNSYITVEEEIALLSKYTSKSEAGQILKISPLHQGLCALLGKEVSLSTTYRLAHRHGWRKIAPRPHHPNRNQKSAEYFKVFFSETP